MRSKGIFSVDNMKKKLNVAFPIIWDELMLMWVKGGSRGDYRYFLMCRKCLQFERMVQMWCRCHMALTNRQSGWSCDIPLWDDIHRTSPPLQRCIRRRWELFCHRREIGKWVVQKMYPGIVYSMIIRKRFPHYWSLVRVLVWHRPDDFSFQGLFALL